MGHKSWSTAGFWLAVGVAAGMFISDVVSTKTVSADGAATRYEDFCAAVGSSFDNQVDVVWLLDYRTGRLHCIVSNAAGNLFQVGEVDLLKQFELESGSRTKPHFMMITGRNRNTQADMCYLIEVATGQVMSVIPPGAPAQQANAPLFPTIIDKFKFRREGAIRQQ